MEIGTTVQMLLFVGFVSLVIISVRGCMDTGFGGGTNAGLLLLAVLSLGVGVPMATDSVVLLILLAFSLSGCSFVVVSAWLQRARIGWWK